MKYFLLSIFSSALLLFGFSYLYGITGTTNLPAMADAFANNKQALAGNGLPLVALIMIVAGLGFRITAVPFHFYAPDVYQGTSTGMAALLGVCAEGRRLRGPGARPRFHSSRCDRACHRQERVSHRRHGGGGQLLGEQVPTLLWILAAVTMSLGNVLALLQDNIKRLLAYSSVANAGYMLIGLAVAPKLIRASGTIGGVEALWFYLVAYGGMTVGAFAVLHYLSTKTRPVEKVDDLAGLSRSHPLTALVMVLFVLSLIGIPLTAGFAGKFFLFGGAMSVPRTADSSRLFVILAFIGMLNAAVGGWYYLRIAVVMYLRETAEPRPKVQPGPVLAAILVCARRDAGTGRVSAAAAGCYRGRGAAHLRNASRLCGRRFPRTLNIGDADDVRPRTASAERRPPTTTAGAAAGEAAHSRWDSRAAERRLAVEHAGVDEALSADARSPTRRRHRPEGDDPASLGGAVRSSRGDSCRHLCGGGTFWLAYGKPLEAQHYSGSWRDTYYIEGKEVSDHEYDYYVSTHTHETRAMVFGTMVGLGMACITFIILRLVLRPRKPLVFATVEEQIAAIAKEHPDAVASWGGVAVLRIPQLLERLLDMQSKDARR